MDLGRRLRDTGILPANGRWRLHGMSMERSTLLRTFTRVAHAGANAPCAHVGLAAYPVALAAMRRSRCMACR
jgi:hypothetical protein